MVLAKFWYGIFIFLGSDGNADVCFTDPEAQSDPQTGSPPREQVVNTRKQTGDNEFANIMQELSERKAKLFRSSASSAKKKNSLSVTSEPPVEIVAVSYILNPQILIIINIYLFVMI